MTTTTANMFCSRCGEGFEEREKIVNSGNFNFVILNFSIFRTKVINC